MTDYSTVGFVSLAVVCAGILVTKEHIRIEQAGLGMVILAMLVMAADTVWSGIFGAALIPVLSALVCGMIGIILYKYIINPVSQTGHR